MDWGPLTPLSPQRSLPAWVVVRGDTRQLRPQLLTPCPFLALRVPSKRATLYFQPAAHLSFNAACLAWRCLLYVSPSLLLSKLAVSRLQNSGIQKEAEKGDGWLAPHNATGRIIAWSFQSIPSLHASIFRHTAQPLISVMDRGSVVHQGRLVPWEGRGHSVVLMPENYRH